jgi:hypothetical protein
VTYKKRALKRDYQKYLTPEERKILADADQAKETWLRLNRERAAITNRAIQRARYEKGKQP